MQSTQIIEVSIKFRLGDIVTLKAMIGDDELGKPQRLSVEFWDTTGSYSDDGSLQKPHITYWCRVICNRGWEKCQEFVIGERLKTGLLNISEQELCLFPVVEAAEGKP